jgi:hypothetical protein
MQDWKKDRLEDWQYDGMKTVRMTGCSIDRRRGFIIGKSGK